MAAIQSYTLSLHDALPILGDSIAEFTIDSIELPPGERAVLSLQLPKDFVILFDPVTHGSQFIDVKGEPTRERSEEHTSELQSLTNLVCRLLLEKKNSRHQL